MLRIQDRPAPRTPLHVVTPDPAGDPLDRVRRLLHGAGLAPGVHSEIEATLAALAESGRAAAAENARLSAENARLEGMLAAARKAANGTCLMT